MFKDTWKKISLTNPGRHGIPFGLQEGVYSKHLVFTGGVSLACYVLGVVHFIFQRYGTENFEEGNRDESVRKGPWDFELNGEVANFSAPHDAIIAMVFGWS